MFESRRTLQLLQRSSLPLTLPSPLLLGTLIKRLIAKHIHLAINLIARAGAASPARRARRSGATGPSRTRRRRRRRHPLLVLVAVQHGRAGIVARGATAVGHVEAAVEAGGGVQEDDDELNGKVEGVEAALAVVPGGAGGGPGRGVGDGEAEAGAEREEQGGGVEEGEFGAVAALAEFLGAAVVAGEAGCEEGDGDGEEGEESAGGCVLFSWWWWLWWVLSSVLMEEGTYRKVEATRPTMRHLFLTIGSATAKLMTEELMAMTNIAAMEANKKAKATVTGLDQPMRGW